MCSCKDTNTFLIVNILDLYDTAELFEERCVVRVIQSRDTSHVHHLGRICAQKLLNHPVYGVRKPELGIL
jgi:hypothetical protein